MVEPTTTLMEWRLAMSLRGLGPTQYTVPEYVMDLMTCKVARISIKKIGI